MRLAELLERKKELVHKIVELEEFLEKVVNKKTTDQEELTDLRSLLDSYLEEDQRFSMKIERANNQIEVKVGNSKLKLNDAVKIRNTFLNKINNITRLIDSSDGNINLPSFIKQRDQLYEEYLVIHNAICIADWSTELD
jgi:hypothetical protein